MKSHTVERLEIHTEEKQFIYFKKINQPERIDQLIQTKKSKLMAFFELNQEEDTKFTVS